MAKNGLRHTGGSSSATFAVRIKLEREMDGMRERRIVIVVVGAAACGADVTTRFETIFPLDSHVLFPIIRSHLL